MFQRNGMELILLFEAILNEYDKQIITFGCF